MSESPTAAFRILRELNKLARVSLTWCEHERVYRVSVIRRPEYTHFETESGSAAWGLMEVKARLEATCES